MAEAAPAGSAALAGNPEPNPPAGAQNPPAANANTAPWYGEAEYQPIVEAKGWKAPKDVLQSYVNLEKLVGAEKLAAPKSEEDVAAYEAIWNRLGRPANANEYKFKADGIDEKAVGSFKEVAHKIGLTDKQAGEILGFYKSIETTAVQAANENFIKQSEREMAELQSEHGAAFDQFKVDAKRGLKDYGLKPEQLESLERAIGTKAMMKMLADHGKYLREDTSDGESQRGFGLSPAAARQQMADLRLNADFQKAYMDASHPGHKDAVAKMETLAKAAVGKP